MKFNNKYYVLRHGQAQSNVKDIMSCWPEKTHNPLTLEGRGQIKRAAEKLEGKGVELIIASDILRTKQTAEIVSKRLKVKVKYDKRLREYNVGIFNRKKIKELRKFFLPGERFKKKPKQGETYAEIEKRIYAFFRDIDKKYNNKTILIISHQLPLVFLEGKTRGFFGKEIFKKFPKEKRIKTGELRVLQSD